MSARKRNGELCGRQLEPTRPLGIFEIPNVAVNPFVPALLTEMLAHRLNDDQVVNSYIE